MGFNPWEAARKNVVEKWNKSMYAAISDLASKVGSGTDPKNIIVLPHKPSLLTVPRNVYILNCLSFEQQKHKLGRHFILDPVVGPEPLTGSSRMKGGTTTKLLIEVIFVYMLQICYPAKVLPEQDRTHKVRALQNSTRAPMIAPT
jgi:hypothetical protein